MNPTDPADVPAETPSKESGGVLSKQVSGATVVAIVLVVGAVAGGFYVYRMQQSRQEQVERSSITRHESPPDEWKGFQLGISRAQAAQLLVDSGVHWESIPLPGMGVTPWALHANTEVNGHPVGDFSLRFSDDARWDYGGFPKTPDAVVDVEHLIGGTDPQARLNGIKWKVERSDDDVENQTVPLEILKQLGEPHRTERDITGFGNVYYWDWPELKCAYYTVDSFLMLQTPDAIPQSRTPASKPAAQGSGPEETPNE